MLCTIVLSNIGYVLLIHVERPNTHNTFSGGFRRPTEGLRLVPYARDSHKRKHNVNLLSLLSELKIEPLTLSAPD